MPSISKESLAELVLLMQEPLVVDALPEAVVGLVAPGLGGAVLFRRSISNSCAPEMCVRYLEVAEFNLNSAVQA